MGQQVLTIRPDGRLVASRRPSLVWRVVRWLAVRLVLRPLGRLALALGAGATVGTLWLLRATTVGRWRTQALPVWVAGAAVAVPVWPAWAGLSALVAGMPAIHALRARRSGEGALRRALSGREARLWAWTLGGVATWWLTAAGGGWRAALPAIGVGYAAWARIARPARWVRAVSAGTAAATVLGLLVGAQPVTLTGWWPPAAMVAVAAPWWWAWRRVRPAVVPAIVARWDEEVGGADPKYAGALAGTEIIEFGALAETADGPCGDAVLALPHGTVPSKVTSLDELAEHLLDAPAGTVAIGRHPRLSQRFARIRFTPASTADVIRYFEEPTYDPATGLFLAGYAHESAPAHAAFHRDGGAMHWAVVGGTGAGKGGTERLVMAEAALSPLVLPIFLDGKFGTGCPSVKDGMGFYARTPTQWRDALYAVVAMMQARMDRYGLTGRDRFTPGPGEPLILAWADEWMTVHTEHPGLVRQAARLTREGRSLGCAFGAALQKGDAYGWGDVAIRGNVYAGGTVWLGTAGDASSAGVASQTYGVDLTSLPGVAGWGAWLSKVNGVGDGEKARGLFLPSQSDVDDGKPAPFGRCEDWMLEAVKAGTARPTLHPDEQAILDRLVHGDPGLSADAQDASSDADRTAKATTLDRLLVLLAGLGEGSDGMTRGDIALAVGGSVGHVSTVLGGAKSDGLVDQSRAYGPYLITEAGRDRALEVAA
jgi:hypothetical protein